MTRFILPSVATDGITCTCVACNHALGPATGIWKTFAISCGLPLARAGGDAYDTGFPDVLLRQFICPG